MLFKEIDPVGSENVRCHVAFRTGSEVPIQDGRQGGGWRLKRYNFCTFLPRNVIQTATTLVSTNANQKKNNTLELLLSTNHPYIYTTKIITFTARIEEFI